MAKCGDDFRVRATTIVILLFFSGSVFAGYDLSLGGSLRSYPLSGEIEADAGYDFLLWGTAGGGSPLYGFLRPHLDGFTTVSYNSAVAALDFYPLSILGGSAGYESVQNDEDYKAYDCVTYICRGRYYHSFVQGDLTLGAGALFVQGRIKRETWSPAVTSPTRFIEPTSGLALTGTGDAQTVYRGMAGFKLNPTWSLAAILVYVQSDSNGISRFPFGVVRYNSGPFSLGVGGGVFSSTLMREEPSAVLFLNWDVKPSLALD